MIVKNSIAPYFQDIVVEELKSLLDLNMEEIRSGGYKVYTTLETDQQLALQTASESVLNNGEIQVGAVAMDLILVG